MKIDFDQVVTELNGKAVTMAVGPEADSPQEPLTLGRACTIALTNDTTGDGVAKDRRFRMALKLMEGGVIDIPTSDVAWVKEVVGRIIISTVHCGRIWQLLEQENEDGK